MKTMNIVVQVRPGASSADTPEFAFFSKDPELNLQTGDISLSKNEEYDLVFELQTADITWSTGNDARTPHPLSFRLASDSGSADACWIWESHLLRSETKTRYSGSQFSYFPLSANAGGTPDMVLRVHAVNSDHTKYKYRISVGALVSPGKIVALTKDPKIKNTGSGFLEQFRMLLGIT